MSRDEKPENSGVTVVSIVVSIMDPFVDHFLTLFWEIVSKPRIGLREGAKSAKSGKTVKKQWFSVKTVIFGILVENPYPILEAFLDFDVFDTNGHHWTLLDTTVGQNGGKCPKPLSKPRGLWRKCPKSVKKHHFLTLFNPYPIRLLFSKNRDFPCF